MSKINKLTIKQMMHIFDNGLIETCSEEEKDQVNRFAFGDDFMDSDDKGSSYQYEENQG